MTPSVRRVPPSQRFVRRQRSRRWQRWRLPVALATVAVLVGVAVWAVFFSSLLAVRFVQVDGTRHLSVAQVRSAARVPIGVPLARTDLDAVAARVRDLSPVLSVRVSRGWPHTVAITVTERTPVAVVASDGVYRALDAHGVLFRTFPHRPPHLPLVRMPRPLSVPALAEVARVVSVLPASLAHRVDHIEASSIDSIVIALHRGARVVWGSAEESPRKARVLAALLHHRARSYDVSVPEQPTITRG